MIGKQLAKSLEYVRNTNGGATPGNFMEDFEPIGERLWHEMLTYPVSLINIGQGRKIHLTQQGSALLDEWEAAEMRR